MNRRALFGLILREVVKTTLYFWLYFFTPKAIEQIGQTIFTIIFHSLRMLFFKAGLWISILFCVLLICFDQVHWLFHTTRNLFITFMIDLQYFNWFLMSKRLFWLFLKRLYRWFRKWLLQFKFINGRISSRFFHILVTFKFLIRILVFIVTWSLMHIFLSTKSLVIVVLLFNFLLRTLCSSPHIQDFLSYTLSLDKVIVIV